MAIPAVVLKFDPNGPEFPISEQCVMPTITATATLQNITPDPKVPLQYQWDVTLVFTGAACVHSMSRKISHAPICAVTPANQFKIPFTQVRGGELTVKVSVKVGATVLTAQSTGLTVAGTNPTVGSLMQAAPANEAFRKLLRLESGLRQFRAPGCPLFSGDDFGGVGLCQLTRPAPSEDQVWSWKENLQGGIALWQTKEAAAKGYPAEVRKSTDYQNLVVAYNAQRAATAAAAAKAAGKPAAATPAVTVTLPDYTSDQLQRDTLRGFNGYAGQLHQYRVKVDANGLLVVTLNPAGTQGTAEWEEISAADRNKYYDKIGLAANRRGDPNYVDDVERQATF